MKELFVSVDKNKGFRVFARISREDHKRLKILAITQDKLIEILAGDFIREGLDRNKGKA
jgi:hypothetical protein